MVIVIVNVIGFRLDPRMSPPRAIRRTPMMSRLACAFCASLGGGYRPDALGLVKAEVLRKKMVTAEALKHFVSHVRCAAYPDVAAHERSRAQVEKAWPAYADDLSLSRLPQFFWNSTQASPE